MTRSVLFDLETTGLSPETGDRVIEIAALELINDVPTGKNFHVLIDPERDIPNESTRVHGFTYEHLHGKPKFVEIVDSFLAFIEDSPLIAHNAGFDFSFLNMELQRIGYAPLSTTPRSWIPASSPPRPSTRGWSSKSLTAPTTTPPNTTSSARRRRIPCRT